MEFFRDTSYDFMRVRRISLALSGVLLVFSVLVLFQRGGLNLGIDFAGGTQLTLRFAEPPDVQELRSLLESEGIPQAQIQRYGDVGKNEVLIKTPSAEGFEEGSRGRVEAAFDRHFNADGAGKPDLNKQGVDSLTRLLSEKDPDGVGTADQEEVRSHYGEVAGAIADVRRSSGLITSWGELEGLDGVSEATLRTLRDGAFLGHYTVLGSENVGPQIGSELRLKGILAVIFSLVGMLMYIWWRFELRFGIGALAALSHDVLICLGLFGLMGYEFNLTTIAAFLTVVGYSVNDSVVVFDRVRENLRRSRREPLRSVLNRSLNQTLSRTVLTSGTTFMAVGTLFVLGGGVIRGFAFVLMIGVVVGTYSSIFVASPFVLFWESLFRSQGQKKGRPARRAAAVSVE